MLSEAGNRPSFFHLSESLPTASLRFLRLVHLLVSGTRLPVAPCDRSSCNSQQVSGSYYPLTSGWECRRFSFRGFKTLQEIQECRIGTHDLQSASAVSLCCRQWRTRP